jgi:hypothetical protein
MIESKVFKTKTGYCHINEDEIVLTRNGVIGNAAKVTMGNHIARPLIIYGIISIGCFFLSIKGYNQQDYGGSAIFLVLGALLIINIYKSWNNSGTPIIQRASIKSIEFRKAMPGATRAYFIVYFEDSKGSIKKRLIMLPGSISNGAVEAEKALIIMSSEFKDKINAS